MIAMPPTLEGDLVRLRAMRDDDAEFCHDVANDPDLRGHLRFERPKTLEGERMWMQGLDDERERFWIFETRDDARRVGILSYTDWNRIACVAELGITVLDAADRGRGHGGDALRTAIRHGFLEMGLQRIHLTVYDHNPARRLYERHGFHQEGRLRRHVYKMGAYRDVLVMGLLREEWTG